GPRRPPRSRTARAGARPKRSNRKPHAARTGSVPPAWGRLDSFSIGGGDDHERTLTASRAQRLDRPYVGQGLHQRPGPGADRETLLAQESPDFLGRMEGGFATEHAVPERSIASCLEPRRTRREP